MTSETANALSPVGAAEEQVRAAIAGFDHHSPEYADTWPSIYAAMRATCPVARSDSYDGFWIPSRYADIFEIARDVDTFTSDHDVSGDGSGYAGVVIPEAPITQVPIELDGPEFRAYRSLLNPKFSPREAKLHDDFLADVSNACLNTVCESGAIDVIDDLANPVPAILTLEMLGLPTDDWERFARPFHQIAYQPPGTEGFGVAVMGILEVLNAVQEAYEQRLDAPADDFISFLATSRIDGEPLPLQRVLEICTLIFVGGVDTTTALVGNAVVWLGEHPDQRQRLLDDPSLLPVAGEEMLRYFSPAHSLARTVTRDVELGGQHLSAGDRVLVPWCAANRDPEMFDDPDELIIDRHPNKHMAFGVGAHRCLGSNIARREFLAMMTAILTRMPDIVVDTSRATRYTSVGNVNGWINLPATFTPSATVPTTFAI